MSSRHTPGLWVNEALVEVPALDPNLSLLQFLREQRSLTGTKEGCGSGDCGACTVLVHDPATGRSRPVNACITPLGAVLGCQAVTVEGIGTPAALHPVQQAMVDAHGSQCGFCTPGFVMALVGAQLGCDKATLAQLPRAELVRAVSGNLCRCTGYRPILSAAAAANARVAEAASGVGDWIPALGRRAAGHPAPAAPGYLRPADEAGLRAALAAHPDRGRVPMVAGATDLWLEVSQRYRDFDAFIDVGGVRELRAIERRGTRLHIGAAVTHAELVDWFAAPAHPCPAIVEVMQRFGSPQIRGRATLGGNLANASPIADWPPLLLAADARVVLRRADGAERSLDLEDFYLGYRQTVLADDEYLAAVDVDAELDGSALAAFKISKREDDDISSALGAFYVTLDAAGAVDVCRIAFGGVAPVPVRFGRVEDLLRGRRLDDASIDAACRQLRADLAPIGDVRASAAYRREVSVNLLRKALAGLLDGAPRTLAAVLGR